MSMKPCREMVFRKFRHISVKSLVTFRLTALYAAVDQHTGDHPDVKRQQKYFWLTAARCDYQSKIKKRGNRAIRDHARQSIEGFGYRMHPVFRAMPFLRPRQPRDFFNKKKPM